MRVVFCFARGRSSCFGAMCCQCCPSSSGRLLRLGPAEHARAAALLCDLRIDPRTLSRYRSCTVSLIWSRVISPTVFFFAKNGFSTFRAYSFPNFRIRCLSTKKKTLLVQILIGITLNLQIALGRIDSFTVCDLHSMSTARLSICLGLLRFINIL